METEFHRIKRRPPYGFAEVTAMSMRAAGGGANNINFGFPVENRHRTRQAVRNIKSFLSCCDRVLEDGEKRRAVAS